MCFYGGRYGGGLGTREKCHARRPTTLGVLAIRQRALIGARGNPARWRRVVRRRNLLEARSFGVDGFLGARSPRPLCWPLYAGNE